VAVTGLLGNVADAEKKDAELLYVSVRGAAGGSTQTGVLIKPVKYDMKGLIAG